MPRISNNIDKILSQVPDEEKQSFLSLVDARVTLVDLQKCLAELCGFYEITIPVPTTISIHKWRQKRFTLAKQIENFNLLNSEYEGVEVKDIVERLIFRVADLCFKSLDLIEGKTEEISAVQQFKQLPGLVRELRQLCQMLQDFKSVKTEQEIAIGSVSEFYLMLKSAVADTPFEQGFNEMAVAAIDEMKLKIRN